MRPTDVLGLAIEENHQSTLQEFDQHVSFGGFHSHGETPIGWFISWNIPNKNGWFGGKALFVSNLVSLLIRSTIFEVEIFEGRSFFSAQLSCWDFSAVNMKWVGFHRVGDMTVITFWHEKSTRNPTVSLLKSTVWRSNPHWFNISHTPLDDPGSYGNLSLTHCIWKQKLEHSILSWLWCDGDV